MKAMRRKDRLIPVEESRKILIDSELGILSTTDEKGQPYGVPLNYVFKNDAIYFHCAKTGQKLDNIKKNPKVSFTVVGKTNVLPCEFATEYESVIAFGKASEVEDTEFENALLWLLEKYSPEFLEEGKAYIDKMIKATKVVKITIGHISGKARKPS